MVVVRKACTCLSAGIIAILCNEKLPKILVLISVKYEGVTRSDVSAWDKN